MEEEDGSFLEGKGRGLVDRLVVRFEGWKFVKRRKVLLAGSSEEAVPQ
jgi:hypothetical protein